MSSSNKIRFTASISDRYLNNVDKVVSEVKQIEGVQVEQVLKSIGIITGLCNRSDNALRKIEGIDNIETDAPEVWISPPDSNVQ